MSAIASFYLIEVSKLGELEQNAEVIVKKSFFSKKVTDTYWDFISGNSKHLMDFSGSGYVYATVLVFLKEEKNIDLFVNEFDKLATRLTEMRNCSHIFFTNQQRIDYFDQLDHQNYSLSELQKFNQDLSEDGDIETAKQSIDAIRILRENLKELKDEKNVLLLIIG